ncbi:MAG: terminase large subunit [Nitrospinota bacterium]|nr:terminase large subunit [Nitrospinota bacterium]
MIAVAEMSRDELETVAAGLEEMERRAAGNWLDTYSPYPTQERFHAAEVKNSQVLFMGGNQTGKTTCGAAAIAYHLTGRYPKRWKGRRFTAPIKAWAGSPTGETTRDGVQTRLLGDISKPSGLGTGAIPRKYIHSHTVKRGIKDSIDVALIKHSSGGWSKLQFKSYDQGREKWQSEVLDLVWFDEEPPADIYSEGITRVVTKKGLVLLTFTPLKGMSEVVNGFIKGAEKLGGGREIITATWDDAPHLDKEARERLADSYSPHEKDARTKGIPALGSGLIYPVREEAYLIDPILIPDYYPRMFALDVGWNRTAALWAAWDRQADIVYVWSEHYLGQEPAPVHASAIKARGDWMPGVIDPAARGRAQTDGERLIDHYRGEGLKLEPAKNAVEAGIHMVLDRINQGRLKIFKTLSQTLREMKQYHRDEKGRVVKENDHLMDCLRYLILNLDQAKTKPEKQARRVAGGDWMSN